MTQYIFLIVLAVFVGYTVGTHKYKPTNLYEDGSFNGCLAKAECSKE